MCAPPRRTEPTTALSEVTTTSGRPASSTATSSDHVVGQHPGVAEQHPHPARTAGRRGGHPGPVEHHGDLHGGPRGQRGELPHQAGALVGQRELRDSRSC